MRIRNKNIKYSLCLVFALFKMIGQDGWLREVALVSRYLEKASQYASVNPDSAHYYGFMAENKAEKLKNDSLLAQAWFITAKTYYLTSDYNAALLYQSKTLKLAKKINDRSLIARAYNLHGAILFNEGKYEEALVQYNNKLRINTAMADTSAMLQGYYNISLIYNTLGNLKQYVEMVHRALDLAERTKDTINIMVLNEGLGSAYNDMNNPRRGIPFLQKAYQLASVKKQEYDLSGIFIDMGNIYQSLNLNDSATFFYKEAIKLTERNGDKKRHAIGVFNLGRIAFLEKNYPIAIKYTDEAIRLAEEINYQKGICEALLNRSETLLTTGSVEAALSSALRAKEIATALKTKREEAAAYDLLTRIYDKQGNKKDAYFSFKRSIGLRDSLETNSQLRTIQGIELDYEKEKLQREQKFLAELAVAELRKQKRLRNVVIFGCSLMFILLIFTTKNYLAKQKTNREISKQKKIIEEKNHAIIESINYAKQIQSSMLPSELQIKNSLPESFILFKPKDIVSGDFYFVEPIHMAKSGRWTAIVLADCTGHGVPGALMSITGYNLLRQSINEPSVTSPGEALDFLNNELHTLLRQDKKEIHIRDGMDISFCAINSEENLLMFSGANNPVWILSSNPGLADTDKLPITLIKHHHQKFLYEIKANKQHIGFNETPRPFNTRNIYLSQCDMIYLFTDGFADQFGGPSGKKYKYKQLADALFEVSDLSMREQKVFLENSFDTWKGDLEQVDDVSLMGIRI